jgi:hypothetical protein
MFVATRSRSFVFLDLNILFSSERHLVDKIGVKSMYICFVKLTLSSVCFWLERFLSCSYHIFYLISCRSLKTLLAVYGRVRLYLYTLGDFRRYRYMWLNIISEMVDRSQRDGRRRKEDRLINVDCEAPNEEESTHPSRHQLCDRWSKNPEKRRWDREKGREVRLFIFIFFVQLRSIFANGHVVASHLILSSVICWLF